MTLFYVLTYRVTLTRQRCLEADSADSLRFPPEQSEASPRSLSQPAEPRSNMVCGGFTCSKNALCSLNVVYMPGGQLSSDQMGTSGGAAADWSSSMGQSFGLVSSIHIIGGVIAVGSSCCSSPS
ncbi:hypothetical protein INR49_031724 [Caranx melampygus]|nr:hypothetical protein INR49_031724 [Caranx melampygus]